MRKSTNVLLVSLVLARSALADGPPRRAFSILSSEVDLAVPGAVQNGQYVVVCKSKNVRVEDKTLLSALLTCPPELKTDCDDKDKPDCYTVSVDESKLVSCPNAPQEKSCVQFDIKVNDTPIKLLKYQKTGVLPPSKNGDQNPTDDSANGTTLSTFGGQLVRAYAEAIAQSGADSAKAGDYPHNIYEPHAFGPDIAILFYYQDGSPIFPVPMLDENDKIFLVVVPDKSQTITKIAPVNCTQGQDVRVGGSALPFGITPVKTYGQNVAKPEVARYRILMAQNCGSEQGLKATISYRETSDANGEKQGTVTLSTLPLHRITVALGVIYNFSPVTDFKAAAVKGESVPVIIQNDHRL